MHGYMHDLEPMVPGGALRRMEGEIHRNYRRALLSGIQFDELFSKDHELHEIVSGKLAGYASAQGQVENPAQSYIDVLNDIATASLIKVFFGVGIIFDKPYWIIWVMPENRGRIVSTILSRADSLQRMSWTIPCLET
jgi:hypothetical protein